MTIGRLFIEALSTGVISQAEMSWVAKHQELFSRCEAATALRLGRLIDSGQINLENRI